MGGSGGSSFTPPSESARERVEQMLAREKERLQSDLSDYLAKLLSQFNSRDADRDNERLDELAGCLGEDIDIEALLLGGSVAKHTAVDGLSDVDALLILDKPEVHGKLPSEVLDILRSILQSSLDKGDIESIRAGQMAVTVQYTDGNEIQLVPAVRSGKDVMVSNAEGTAWKDINPKEFQKKLSNANEAANGALIPAIKLMKAVNDTLPAPKQMTGYHIEALAVDAIREYSGPRTLKAVFERVIEHAASRVMKPIQDITGQSRTVDDYLGVPDGPTRRNVSQTLSSVRRRLGAATSVSDWKSVLEG